MSQSTRRSKHGSPGESPRRPSRIGRSFLTRLLLAVSSLGVAIAVGALATPAMAEPATTTLPGFNHVRPVFQANGFKPFKTTYVRCYTEREWIRATEGERSIMGFYRGGTWIHARASACNNSAKAIRGQINPTNVVALATVLHETIHRQGVRDEATTECLSQWMTGHAVKAWTGSERKSLTALGTAAAWAKKNLPARYQMSVEDCGRLAARWGIQELTPPHAPAPPAPTPPPPAGPSPAPIPPASPAVVFDHTYSDSGGSSVLPPVRVNGARRIEISYSVAGSGAGSWNGTSCSVDDDSAGLRYAGFGSLRPGQSTSVTIDHLSGTSATVMLSLVPLFDSSGQYPGPITIRIVGYR